MSSAKKNNFKDEPMFKFDPETGKYIPLPLKWLIPSDTKAENIMQSNMKRRITITPLKLADLEESPNRAPKVRKTDSVRKGLFNLPPVNRPAPSRRSIPRRSIIKTRKTQQKKNPCELSPLLDMEEVEEELLNKNAFFKGYPFRTPSKPAIKFSKNITCSPLTRNVQSAVRNTPKKDMAKTPESSSSNETEFLELEKMCCVDESDKENNHSPISSVCNLLEGTVLGSTKKHKNSKTNSITNVQEALNNIEDILKESEKTFNQFKASHEENLYKVVQILDNDRADYTNLITGQETNLKKIETILNGLRNSTDGKTDNNKSQVTHNRRSVRLLNKSPIQKSNTKKIVSPIVMKSGDLRKSTLTKNLVAKTQQYQIQSPRIQKALDMYNSMRGEISVLATPKLDRKLIMESPKSSNMSQLLSRRVQSQCLLLQDTPVHRK